YIGKQILLSEMHALGYLTDPSIIAFGDGWLRLENAIFVTRRIEEEIQENITRYDLEQYNTAPANNIWFSLSSDSSMTLTYKKVYIRTLPVDFYESLAYLQQGDSVTNELGVTFHLDSLVSSEPGLETSLAYEADSMAILNICRERTKLFLNNLQQTAIQEYNVAVDNNNLYLFCKDAIIDPDILIIVSDYRNWNAREFQYEIDFLETRMPVQEGVFVWNLTLSETIILHSTLLQYTGEFFPAAFDSLKEARDTYLRELALQRYYNDHISNTISINRSDLEEQYALLNGTFMFEERRVIETVIVPDERINQFEQANLEGNVSEIIVEMLPLERLSDSDMFPRISRPMRLVEIPAQLGDTVFLLSAFDTISWHGPFPITEVDGSICFRLASIVPGRVAEIDEITYDLTVLARERLEQEAINAFMLELYEKYEVSVNSELLERLPADLTEW
ncbi:MAG: hypothetical protein ACTSWQ_05495, partial [Candidatus Thorarchaeota archaeon]